VQTGEPFGLVLTEAMACGTPVAALDRGAVREIVEDGITGGIFSSLDQMVDGLAAVVALDRASVRSRTVARFGVEKMIDAYEEMYARLATGKGGADGRRSDPQRIDAALAPGTGS
jgi:glycosyltransferase involved in cell wall biosynthesis